jgi:hypothetical protein
MEDNMKFRKKPVVVEAEQWFEVIPIQPHDGNSSIQHELGVDYFRHPDISGDTPCKHCGRRIYFHGWIDTLEGGHIVCPGDYVITGMAGERYPCKPDIFAATYDPIES